MVPIPNLPIYDKICFNKGYKYLTLDLAEDFVVDDDASLILRANVSISLHFSN